jgi:predicted Mrr-cat superfamily restriction endonuclease
MTNLWMVRPIPHGHNQMQYFLSHNRIAVGYPLGSNLQNLSNQEIRNKIREVDASWESGINNVEKIVYLMQKGDIVIVPEQNARDIYFAEIVSDYIYEPSLDENKEGSGFPHQREVRWYFEKRPFPRSELPEALTKSLRFPGATSEITKHLPLVAEIIGNKDLMQQTQSSIFSFEHLYDKALHVVEEALENKDQNIALKAAEIVLNYSK